MGRTRRAGRRQSLPESSHYRSTIIAIEPPIPGLIVAVTNSGESLTVTNHTGRTVLVIGYAGEDYLRITPAGVDENIASLSSSLKGNLVIAGLPQPQQQPDQQQPDWRQVSDQPTFTWHDHRIHWMAQQRPPVVAADPKHPHRVFDWTVPLSVDGRPVAVNGVLDWTGLPTLSTLQIVLLALAGISGVVLGLAIVVAIKQQNRGPTGGQHEPVHLSNGHPPAPPRHHHTR